MDPIQLALAEGLPENLARYMPRMVKIESGGDPNAVTGKYTGVLQMGPDERAQYGGNSAASGVKMYADRAKQFAQQNGRWPDPTEFYLLNQQGPAGLASHMKNPGAPAWQNMYATGEGQAKGPEWSKKAIIWNIPNDQRAQYGMVPGNGPRETAYNMQHVDKVSSNNFMDGWRSKVERTAVPPRPPADVPNAPPSGAPAPTTAQAFSPTATADQKAPLGNTAAAAVGSAAPGEIPTKVMPGPKSVFNDQKTPPVVGTGEGTVPLPQARPYGAGPAVPADQKPASTPAPAAGAAPPAASRPAAQAAAVAPTGKTLGERIIESYGPRGQNLSTYVDPKTGHQFITGSVDGETINRDIGPAGRPAQSGATSAPPRASSRPPPTGPVPPAPEAAGTLAKPELGPPERTLDALNTSRQKPNALAGVYGSQTPPQNPPGPPSLGDIAAAPATPLDVTMPRDNTKMQRLPLAPYNVGGPSGTPLPPERPGRGNLGPQPAPNFLSAPVAATPQEQDMRDRQRTADAARDPTAPGGGPLAFNLPQGSPPGPPRAADQYGAPGMPPSGLVKAFQDAVAGAYRPGFLDPTAPAATPQEQTMRGVGQAATTGLPFALPPPQAQQPPMTPPPMPPAPQQQSMLPPGVNPQWGQQMPWSPFNTQAPPMWGGGGPDWTNYDQMFSGGGGGFAGGEGFAFTPG